MDLARRRADPHPRDVRAHLRAGIVAALLREARPDHVRTRDEREPAPLQQSDLLQDHLDHARAERGLQPRGNRRATEEPTGYPSVTAEGLGAAAQTMGAAHRSARRRAQAIEDQFETLHPRRLALSASGPD